MNIRFNKTHLKKKAKTVNPRKQRSGHISARYAVEIDRQQVDLCKKCFMILFDVTFCSLG